MASKIHKSIRNDIENTQLSKIDRKAKRNIERKHAKIVAQLIPLGEELKQRSTNEDRKKELCDEFVKLTKNILIDLAYPNDTSRIIQCVMQRGSAVHRDAIFEELKPNLIEVIKQKFARFVGLKMLKIGTKQQRLDIFQAIRGNVMKLLKHVNASDILERVFNDYANAAQRSEIMNEVYKTINPNKSDTRKYTSLHDLLENCAAGSHKKNFKILHALTQIMLPIIEKNLTKHFICQHILLELTNELINIDMRINHPSTSTSASKTTAKKDKNNTDNHDLEKEEPSLKYAFNLMAELVGSMMEQLVPMLHTREGAILAINMLCYAPIKARKTLLKSLKTFVANMACNEHGFLFVLALLDNTALTNIELAHKHILLELTQSFEQLCDNAFGRKVLAYVLEYRPRGSATEFFSPALWALLRGPHGAVQHNHFCAADDDGDATSSSMQRNAELREALIGPLLEWMANQVTGRENNEENGGFLDGMLSDASKSMFLSHVLQSSIASRISTDQKKVMQWRNTILRSLVESRLNQPYLNSQAENQQETQQETQREREKRKRKQQKQNDAQSAKKKKLKVSDLFVGMDDDDENDNKENGNAMEVEEDCENVRQIKTHFLETKGGEILCRQLVQIEANEEEQQFIKLCLELIEEANLKTFFCCNRTCFFLVHIFEASKAENLERIRAFLKNEQSLIRINPLSAAKVLFKKIDQ